MLSFVVVAVMLANVCAKKVYTSCAHPDSITSFQFGDCIKSPCTFTRGAVYHVKITFTAPLSTDIFVKYSTMKVGNKTFPTEGVIGCDLLVGAKCPLVGGQSYTSEYDTTFSLNLPKGPGSLTTIRMTEDCKTITCSKMDVIFV